MDLDLSKYTEGHPVANYRLKGVIIHHGSPAGGHYFSYVRIGEEFYEFNDTNVRPLSRNEFLSGEGLRNARVLIYCKAGAEIDGWEVGRELTDEKWGELPGTIAADRMAIWKRNLMLNRPFTELVAQFGGFEEVRDFYFDVFCHSSHSDLGGRFIDRFRGFGENSAGLVRWMTDNFDAKISPAILSANREIRASIINLIRQSTEPLPIPVSGPLLNQLIPCLSRNRQFNELNVPELLLSFLQRGPEAVEFARAKGWAGFIGRAAEGPGYREIAQLLGIEERPEAPVAREQLQQLDILQTARPPPPGSARHPPAGPGRPPPGASAGGKPTDPIAAFQKFLRETDPVAINTYLTDTCTTLEAIQDVIDELPNTNDNFRRASVMSVAIFAAWTLQQLAHDCRNSLEDFLRSLGNLDRAAVLDELQSFLAEPGQERANITPSFFRVVLDIARQVRPLPYYRCKLDRFPPSSELNELRKLFEGDSAGRSYSPRTGAAPARPPVPSAAPPSPSRPPEPSAAPPLGAWTPPQAVDRGSAASGRRGRGDFRGEFARRIDALTNPNEAALLRLIGEPNWRADASEFCAIPSEDDCQKLATLVRYFCPYVATAEIQAAAILVIFGDGGPRPPAYLQHFTEFFKPVIDALSGDKVNIPIFAKVINSCMVPGHDADVVLGHLIPAFSAQCEPEGKIARRLKALPIFEPDAVVAYFEITPAPRSFEIVKVFVTNRLKVNAGLKAAVGKSHAGKPATRLTPILKDLASKL
jgi:hypothetical protein